MWLCGCVCVWLTVVCVDVRVDVRVDVLVCVVVRCVCIQGELFVVPGGGARPSMFHLCALVSDQRPSTSSGGSQAAATSGGTVLAGLPSGALGGESSLQPLRSPCPPVVLHATTWRSLRRGCTLGGLPRLAVVHPHSCAPHVRDRTQSLTGVFPVMLARET